LDNFWLSYEEIGGGGWSWDKIKESEYLKRIFDMICNEVNPDEIISLIPFPHARLSTNGLKWELEEEVLELSIREGARNRAVSTSLSIKLHEGRLLFFCDTRFPNIPIFT